jgi:hypothetical protein
MLPNSCVSPCSSVIFGSLSIIPREIYKTVTSEHQKNAQMLYIFSICSTYIFRSFLTVFRVRCYRVSNITVCAFVQGVIIYKYIFFTIQISCGMYMYYQQLKTLFTNVFALRVSAFFCTPSSVACLRTMFPVHHKHFTIHLDLVSFSKHQHRLTFLLLKSLIKNTY